jgi:hypothetical protein
VYGPYAFFPLIAACVWLANLLGLMAMWVVDGKPRYSRGDAVVVFISDVGGSHKVCYDPLVTVCERVLIYRNSSSQCVVVLLVSTFSRYSQRGG